MAVANQTPVGDETLTLYHHDKYDGTNAPLLSWTVATDWTGATIKLVMWKKGDPDTKIITDQEGTVASATSVTVSMEAEFTETLTFAGCPGVSEHEFALLAMQGSDEATITSGQLFIYERAQVS